MKSLKEKTIAVASGKGGVGKTTTCVNLAVYFARNNLKTALLDIDPLSDIATLLDLSTEKKKSGTNSESLGENIIKILPDLDLVFPEADTDRNNTPVIELLKKFSGELAETYDKIILDLPAGSLFEDNMAFLQFTESIIIVTNDEPTSHTASGYYIKKAYEGGSNLKYLLWHNKYAGISVGGFDPRDLPGNYNKNVAEEDRFDFSETEIIDAAFIPHDPAMDLLQSSPSFIVNILAQMSERLDFLIEQRIDEISFSASLPGKSGSLIRHYLHLNPYIKDTETTFKGLSEYIFTIMNSNTLSSADNYSRAVAAGGIDVFSEQEKSRIIKLIEQLRDDPFLKKLLMCSAQLKVAVDEQNNSNRLFFSNPGAVSLKAVDKRISSLLRDLHAERNNHNSYIKSTAGLLLFDFSVYKLLSSKTVTNLITDFIPLKKNSRGEKTRDKHSQIMQLIREDESYKKDYLRLIDVLFPVVLKQIGTIVETFNIAGLIFNNSDGVQKDVYLKLLSAFLHNSINSGLGIVVGFPFRPASAAFEKYASALI